MKEKYEIIFCVLTYKNCQDLEDFLKSLNNNIKKQNYKVVVVNSFFDEITSIKIKKIALDLECDFLEVPNKGYGAGNNSGVNYVKNKYDYEFLIISNPDIEILNFNEETLKRYRKKEKIIAPQIINTRKKNQNPMNYKYSYISENLIYKGFIKNNKIFFYLGICLIKFIKLWGKVFNFKKQEYKIYCPHGSFIIFTSKVIEKLGVIFDENIFLYGEEGDLAQKCKIKDIKIIYNPKIKVFHKEDGSANISNFDLDSIIKESQIYYYNKWYLSGNKR